ncbi:unnamed protein product [Dibothriocephalus latus]|uniref:Uncharacterized protein n=1 Tax=Dibothriocephalus latus TaxID=60516 RepID=A0A3P6THR8_DIBLA|nr:unnamed protein product [Dibothriocephalus latus]
MASSDSDDWSHFCAVFSCVIFVLLGVAGVVAGSVLIAQNPLPYGTSWWYGENSTWNSWWNEPYSEQWYYGWGVTILVCGLILLVCSIGLGACAMYTEPKPEPEGPAHPNEPGSYVPYPSTSKAGPPPPYKG